MHQFKIQHVHNFLSSVITLKKQGSNQYINHKKKFVSDELVSGC